MTEEMKALRRELAAYEPENFSRTLPALHSRLEKFRKAAVNVDVERAVWYTRTYQSLEGKSVPEALKRAKALKEYFSRRAITFPDDNPLAGGSTSFQIGAPLYPEFLTGLSIWPELDTISERKANPQNLSKKDADLLNFLVFPYWMDRTIVERVRPEDPQGIDLLNRMVLFTTSKAAVISHTTPCYRLILEEGGLALMAQARERAAAAKNPEEKIFHESTALALEGLLAYARRLAASARRRAWGFRNSSRRRFWLEMAEVLDRVPAYPARTFREALNSLWLAHAGVLAESANMALNPGRLDQILLPYFRKDRQAGRLDLSEALNLAGSLWLKLGDNVNLVPLAAERLFGGAGAVPAVTLGGVTPEGEDGVNELTWLFLKVTQLMPIRDPNVNARVHPQINPPEYRREVARVILSTKAIPAVYNDPVNAGALEAQGQDPRHARDYAVVGCVELGSAGRDFSASSSLFIMLYTVLYMALHRGKTLVTGDQPLGPDTGDPSAFKTMEDLWTAFGTQLEWMAGRTVSLNNLFGKKHQEYLPTPLLSVLFEGPGEKGKDVVDGGGVYNASGATIIGFADVVDSLNALEDICFNPGTAGPKLRLEEFIAHVDGNFRGQPELLDYCRRLAPKYGSGHPRAQANSRRMIDLIYQNFNHRKNYRGGNYRVAYWTMTNHAGYGAVSPAMANGRLEDEVFSSGITPCSQIRTDLATQLGAVASLAGDKIPGAYALNMKFTPLAPTEENAGRLAGVIESYFALGGQQVQFNIHDYKTLQALKDNPQGSEDLLVRVSGYSAWFKSLNVHMQDELIRRSQFEMASGRLVPLAEGENTHG